MGGGGDPAAAASGQVRLCGAPHTHASSTIAAASLGDLYHPASPRPPALPWVLCVCCSLPARRLLRREQELWTLEAQLEPEKQAQRVGEGQQGQGTDCMKLPLPSPHRLNRFCGQCMLLCSNSALSAPLPPIPFCDLLSVRCYD